MRETGKLARVTRILEEDHVMRIETYGSDVLVLVEQILHEKDHADVAMMRTFGKQVGHGFVRLVHEVVDHEQCGLRTIEILKVWQTSMERDSRVLVEQLLIFPIAVHYSTGWWMDHDVRILDQLEDEPSLSAARRTRYQARKWMYERQSHCFEVDDDDEVPERRR